MPESDWCEWFFGAVPAKFWEIKSNRHKALTAAEAILQIKQPADWYQIDTNQIDKCGLGGLLQYFADDKLSMLRDCYPDFDWQEWLFKTVGQGYWKKSENRIRYMQWLGEKLTLNAPKDWYHITWLDFEQNNGSSLLLYYGSYIPLVLELYPKYEWQIDRFLEKSKFQKRLLKIVQIRLPQFKVESNYKKHPDLKFSESGRAMELDVFVPELNIAFEYQGVQHAMPIKPWGGNKTYQDLIRRDQEKRETCYKHGIFLRELDHTWDGVDTPVIAWIEHVLSLREDV